MSRFIIRDEYFGSTIYDRKNIIFTFLNKEETEKIKKGILINKSFIDDPFSLEVLGGDIENTPRGMLYSPVRVYFEITRRCNLRCINCFSTSGISYENELSLNDIIQTLDGLKNDNVMEVRFTGGEPTEREGWEEIINYAKNIGFAVSMNTNGAYKDRKNVDNILGLGIDQLIVSVDGLRESHDHMRGKGNYLRTIENITALIEGGQNLRINTILNHYTINELEPMIKMASDLSAEICFILLRPVGRGLDIKSYIPSINDLNMAVSTINSLRKRYNDTKIMTSYDVISQNSIKPAEDLDLTSCAAGLRGCNINSDGGIYACGFLAELGEEYRLGNIVDQDFSLIEIWRTSNQLMEFRKRSLEKTAECKSCNDYNINCFGSCIVMEKFAESSNERKDPYCYRNK